MTLTMGGWSKPKPPDPAGNPPATTTRPPTMTMGGAQRHRSGPRPLATNSMPTHITANNVPGVNQGAIGLSGGRRDNPNYAYQNGPVFGSPGPAKPGPITIGGGFGGGGGMGGPGGGYAGGNPGGGGSQGGAPPAWMLNQQGQVNPYQEKAAKFWEELYNKAPDFTPIAQQIRDNQAGQMKEMQAALSARGAGNMSGAGALAMRNLGMRGQEDMSEQAANWKNTALQHQLAAAGGYTGNANNIAGNLLGQSGLGIQAFNALANAQNNQQQNELGWYRAQNDVALGQMNMMASLMGLATRYI